MSTDRKRKNGVEWFSNINADEIVRASRWFGLGAGVESDMNKSVVATVRLLSARCSADSAFVSIEALATRSAEMLNRKIKRRVISKTNLQPGEDPPTIDQVGPLDDVEIARRLACFGIHRDASKVRLAEVYDNQPRTIVHHRGRLLPPMLRNRVLSSIEKMIWPSKRRRRYIDAERYAVFKRGESGTFLTACEELMAWVDRQFPYTHVALTKNFQGSPHIDHFDRTYQYTLSLGSFSRGGHLCVESVSNEDEIDGTRIDVIDTHNRVACVDGRYVHWVRGYDEGDRYSLVFYCMSGIDVVEPVLAIREWTPTSG